MMSAGMYRFVITDYLNPLALPTGGVASGEVYVNNSLFCSSSLFNTTEQLHFCEL